MTIFEVEKYFGYDHLPEKLQEISKPFYELAHTVMKAKRRERNEQLSISLQKLLEAKDAAVRSLL